MWLDCWLCFYIDYTTVGQHSNKLYKLDIEQKYNKCIGVKQIWAVIFTNKLSNDSTVFLGA